MTGEPARQAAWHAEAAAEAVRALNHATQPWGDGLTGPADVYDVLGSLELLTARLPQALSQLQAYLTREHTAGRVRIIDGEHAGDPAAAVAATACQLEQATRAAGSLREALEHARELLAWAANT